MSNFFSDNLRMARKALKLIQGDFADKIGVTGGYISDLEKGKRSPSESLINLICLKFGLSRNWLLTGEGEMFAVHPGVLAVLDRRGEKLYDEVIEKIIEHLPAAALTTRAIPVLGRVPAGFPTEHTEEIIEYISLPNIPAGAYALIVHGESMSPMIRNGDYVIFLPGADDVRSGDVVIVNNEWGESMCKRYREKDGEQLLVSDNAEYQAVRPNHNFQVLGKVIKVWRDIKF